METHNCHDCIFPPLLLFLKYCVAAAPKSYCRQPRYNSHASSFSPCNSPERGFCVGAREHACACVSSYCRILQQYKIGPKNTAVSPNERSAFSFSFLFFFFTRASVVGRSVPAIHRKVLTLWQPWCNSSRTSTCVFCDSYERCMRMWACDIKHNEMDDSIPLHLSFKSTRAIQQQRYNNSSSSSSRSSSSSSSSRSGTTPLNLP